MHSYNKMYQIRGVNNGFHFFFHQGKKEITSYGGWRAYTSSLGGSNGVVPPVTNLVKGEPYDWPYNGDLRPSNTVMPAVIITRYVIITVHESVAVAAAVCKDKGS